ncbi:hypothetical protein TNCV_3847051 [Trichonephila clavipes]|nr:hypothetical protein TNCV_3847051 [Trichonephila clavipes]
MALVPLERSFDKRLVRTSVFDPPRHYSLFEETCRRPPRRESPKTDESRQWTHNVLMSGSLCPHPHRRRLPRGQTKDNYPKATCTVSNPQASHLLSICQTRHV